MLSVFIALLVDGIDGSSDVLRESRFCCLNLTGLCSFFSFLSALAKEEEDEGNKKACGFDLDSMDDAEKNPLRCMNVTKYKK